MSDSRDQEFRDRLRELMDSALPESVQAALKKKAQNVADEFVDSVSYWITDSMSYHLAQYVVDMANRAIEYMLAGNEEMFRRYLKCERGGWTGRDREHPVIHGRLSEPDSFATRKALCETFPDLLKNERILDLEDQVASLVKQVNTAEAEREAMWQRLRAVQ